MSETSLSQRLNELANAQQAARSNNAKWSAWATWIQLCDNTNFADVMKQVRGLEADSLSLVGCDAEINRLTAALTARDAEIARLKDEIAALAERDAELARLREALTEAKDYLDFHEDPDHHEEFKPMMAKIVAALAQAKPESDLPITPPHKASVIETQYFPPTGTAEGEEQR